MAQCGFDAIFKSEVPDRLKCPICICVMRNPVQTECGHLFCSACLDPVIKGDNPCCPIDRSHISRRSIRKDKRCMRDISSMEAWCKNKNRGCGWEGSLAEYEDHLNVCAIEEFYCRKCGELIDRDDESRHYSNECRFGIIKCEMCGDMHTRRDMKAHLENECREVERPCPMQCDPTLKMKLRELRVHLDVSCPLQILRCPMSECGCSFQSERKNLLPHFYANRIGHEYMFNRMAKTTSELVDANRELFKSLNEKLARVDAVTIQGKLLMLENLAECNISKEKLSSIETKTLANWRAQDEALARKSTLERSIQKIEEELLSHRQTIRDIQSTVDDISNRVCNFEVSHSGCLVWTIHSFSSILRKSKEGGENSILSPIFVSDRFGYAMRAKMYPNGVGRGKRSHVSIYVSLVKGRSDAIMSWPFSRIVHITMLNKDSSMHKEKAVVPDVRSVASKKPDGGMNTGMGFPDFISHNIIASRGFVNDRKVVIKLQFGKDINSSSTRGQQTAELEPLDD